MDAGRASTGVWRGRFSATASAVGQIIPEERDPNEPPPDPNDKPEVKRVIGVVEEFRQDGELSTPRELPVLPDAARRRRTRRRPCPSASSSGWRPARTAAFEETLVKRAMAVAGDWSFEVQPVDAMRNDKLRQYTIPLMVVGTIAGFLLLMVGARPDRRGLAERDPADPRVRPAPRQGGDDPERAAPRC